MGKTSLLGWMFLDVDYQMHGDIVLNLDGGMLGFTGLYNGAEWSISSLTCGFWSSRGIEIMNDGWMMIGVHYPLHLGEYIYNIYIYINIS